jgi:hypothetical protein
MTATTFLETFDGAVLDESRWLPHYLPHWSSKAESAATYELVDSELRLSIPPDQGLWCADTHTEPLRVSGVQSGAFSGPVGSTTGQQPFVDGLLVREQHPLWRGWTPYRGRIEIRARMGLSDASMASVWMVGQEDSPQRCGEICVFEVFGDAINPEGACVGAGIHPFRDPALTDDFDAPRQPIDVGDLHVYAVDWREDRVDFLIDDRLVRSSPQSPAYPMQVMMAVFDFPAKATDSTQDHEPRLDVVEVVGIGGSTTQ